MKRLFIFLMPLFIMSCSDDEPSKSDSELLEDFFTRYQAQSTIATVRADSTIEFSGEKAGVFITPPQQSGSSCFIDGAGNAVTGNIKIELKELFYRSDFIFNGKPTVTNDNRVLSSYGVFYVKATQNGNPLRLRGVAEIFYSPWAVYPALGTSFNGQLYYGSSDSAGNFEWVDGQQPGTNAGVSGANAFIPFGLYIGTNDTLGNTFYSPEFENLGWINCDDIISDTLPTTSVTATINVSWSGEATAHVFLVFNDINSVMRMDYVVNDSAFVSPSNVPVTFNTTIVVVAVNDGDFYYGTEGIVVTANQQEAVTVTQMSEEDIHAAIKTLDD